MGKKRNSYKILTRKSEGRRPSDRPRPTTPLPPRSNGKPEAGTAVYKLLMMGMKMPETVYKRRAINLRD
jgi:hypothetical protein